MSTLLASDLAALLPSQRSSRVLLPSRVEARRMLVALLDGVLSPASASAWAVSVLCAHHQKFPDEALWRELSRMVGVVLPDGSVRGVDPSLLVAFDEACAASPLPA